MARLRQVAEELDLPFGDRTHTYNSRRAQELGKWAEQQGQGDAYHNAVYRAYFVAGENIARAEVLTKIITKLGLNVEVAGRVLDEGRHAADVDADWKRARELGITAVPTLVYGRHKLVGFHPYADYRQLINS